MRINKFLAQIGIGSRREIDSLIEQGLVQVNDEKAQLGYQLQDGDLINYQDQEFIFDSNQESSKYYYAFNKARGLVCTCAKSEPNNIIDFLEKKYPKLSEQRIFPVGRLDKESTGLLILTNDGDLSQRLSHPKYQHEKEYLVTCKKDIDQDFINKFKAGLKIYKEDEDSELVKTKACKAEQLSSTSFNCILEQGYKRQIRKMVKALANEVIDLKRTRIAGLKLDEIKENELIELDSKQVQSLW